MFEWPLSGKADIKGTAQNFHKIDQLGTSAFRPKPDIELKWSETSANDCDFKRSTQHFVGKPLSRTNAFESEE